MKNWGTPELKHPGTPILYNTNLWVKYGGGIFCPRFGVEREEKLPDGTTRMVSLLGNGYFSKDSEIKDGLSRVHLRRAAEAGLGQRSHRAGTRHYPANWWRQPRRECRGLSRPLWRHPQRVFIAHGCTPCTGTGKARAKRP